MKIEEEGKDGREGPSDEGGRSTGIGPVPTIPKRPETEGVQTLLGDPKRAILKLSGPMIVAMTSQTIYNLADAIWVSGLGADALSAVGFFFPFFFLIMAIGAGLGIGASTALSRRIGADDKSGADDVASHSIFLLIITAIAFTIPFLVFVREIFQSIGAGSILDITVSYARTMFAGTIIIFFVNISIQLLRGEGDAKRSMYVMVTASGLNIVLDPIFIYGLGMGVPGAALATVLSFFVASVVLFRWLFVRKDTFMDFKLRGFRFKRAIIIDIYRVGLPASFMQMAMSFTMFMVNMILVIVEGTDGVAIFSTGWRVAMIAILPLVGFAMGVSSVTGAGFGMRDTERIDTSYMYAVKLGTVIETGLAILAYALAPYIALIFTFSEDAARIYDELVVFFRIMCLFLPFVSFGMLSSALFQGVGKGIYALTVTFLRTVILTAPLAWFFSITLGWGIQGVWWGMVSANIIGALVAFVWARVYLRRLRKRWKEHGDGGTRTKEPVAKVLSGSEE